MYSVLWKTTLGQDTRCVLSYHGSKVVRRVPVEYTLNAPGCAQLYFKQVCAHFGMTPLKCPVADCTFSVWTVKQRWQECYLLFGRTKVFVGLCRLYFVNQIHDPHMSVQSAPRVLFNTSYNKRCCNSRSPALGLPTRCFAPECTICRKRRYHEILAEAKDVKTLGPLCLHCESWTCACKVLNNFNNISNI